MNGLGVAAAVLVIGILIAMYVHAEHREESGQEWSELLRHQARVRALRRMHEEVRREQGTDEPRGA